jgi:CRP-like cAMP-binding protein
VTHSEASTRVRSAQGHATDRLGARIRWLRADPMFCRLSEEEVGWLAECSRTIELQAREILFLEGDECQGLYIVEHGTIRLCKAPSGSSPVYGREQTIRLMTAGDSFNEVPLFDDGPNPVTAEAVTDASVLLVPKRTVRELVRQSPAFAEIVLTLMAGRLRHMLALLEDISMRDVSGRVAKILLQMRQPADGVGAGLVEGQRLTQREIAEMAGTAREVVARILKKFEQAGAISTRRGRVQILDPNLLESLI